MGLSESTLNKQRERVNMENAVATTSEAVWKVPEIAGRFSDEQLYDEIRKASADMENEYEIAVGVDSQIYGRYFTFVTVLCLWRKGHGGLYFFRTEGDDKAKIYHNNQKMRMFDEVAKALEFAQNIENNTNIKPIIHLDVSPSGEKEYTSVFSDQLKGYVISSGYECEIKPYSYAAMCIADRHTKKRRKKRPRR